MIIELASVEAGMRRLAGGKAVGLAELIRAGERVPAGFCLTAEPPGAPGSAAATGPPDGAGDELAAAYRRLGGGPVAVRSSATDEDLPDAGSAGQHDTFLGVRGVAELIDAVRRCRESLHSARAVAYREARGLPEARMAVVVQRMVEPVVAGVLYTANPVTGRRTETVIDAAPGLGTAVVDGRVVPDHYVLGAEGVPEGGCLGSARLAELREAGHRLRKAFGAPQDVEWAFDAAGVLWILQSRPITTLFPAPPESAEARVYVELGGQFQGVFQPFTPMGSAVLRSFAPGAGLVDIAGRIYLDATGTVRDARAATWLPTIVEADLGPRVRSVVETVLADPRFAPLPAPPRTGGGGGPSPRVVLRGVRGVVRSLARPAAARARAGQAVAAFRRGEVSGAEVQRMLWPLLAGIVAAAAPVSLLRGLASEAEVRTVLGGMPHNVTVEMDLALWRLAEAASGQRELLLGTPPAELATRYLAGDLPELGLGGFLARYGHRAAAEIDVGVPRWAEDPAPVFAAIANYLRLTEPEQSPDRRFARAAAEAEAELVALTRRVRWRRPVRGRLAVFLLRRARELAGLRELGKFAGLYPLRETRRRLLAAGAELTAAGLLERPEDVMFLDEKAVSRDGVLVSPTPPDYRDLVAERRAAYQREFHRAHVPVGLLSDGTDVETLRPPAVAAAGTVAGMAASPGIVTGRARVVRDPAGAHLEPGEILVAPTTDPGWTPLFLTAGGLVTEVGAPLAHGPTVAREYGIPAVICVRDATRVIKTGQLITVDGAAGTVTLCGDDL